MCACVCARPCVCVVNVLVPRKSPPPPSSPPPLFFFLRTWNTIWRVQKKSRYSGESAPRRFQPKKESIMMLMVKIILRTQSCARVLLWSKGEYSNMNGYATARPQKYDQYTLLQIQPYDQAVHRCWARNSHCQRLTGNGTCPSKHEISSLLLIPAARGIAMRHRAARCSGRC